MEKERKYTELKRLKKFLKRKNITYNKLSKILDISLDAVNNKLNGYTEMTVIECEKES